ncbi:uncharacterized protein L203_100204 [Cryptococcus depauperatus CBS 7841]|uniref:Uncharacterized protein n=1 Tax=Cryptococcus depauperatus CBS 7841 TaxID=1295531 RepID=A0AAJ8JMM4_9TREE
MTAELRSRTIDISQNTTCVGSGKEETWSWHSFPGKSQDSLHFMTACLLSLYDLVAIQATVPSIRYPHWHLSYRGQS